MLTPWCFRGVSPLHFQNPSLTFFLTIPSRSLRMQQTIGAFRLDRCIQVTEMKNDVQNIRRKATWAFGRHAGTAGICRRFGEQGPHTVAGEEWACTIEGSPRNDNTAQSYDTQRELGYYLLRAGEKLFPRGTPVAPSQAGVDRGRGNTGVP